MAKVWIREYQDRAVAGAGRDLQAVMEPGYDQAPITLSTSALSAAFAASTRFIAMVADGDFHFVVGAGDDEELAATTDAFMVPSSTIYVVGVKAGQKLAVIAAT